MVPDCNLEFGGKKKHLESILAFNAANSQGPHLDTVLPAASTLDSNHCPPSANFNHRRPKNTKEHTPPLVIPEF